MSSAKRLFPLLPLLAISFVVACSDDDDTAAASRPTTDAGPGVVADSGPSTTPPAATKDIVDTAAAAPNLKTLVSAVQGAGLVDTLKGPGPFTVFAPTDDAFAKLPSFLLQQLVTTPYKTELGLILKYHVLSGSVKAADILGKTSTPATVEGGLLSINGAGGKVVINGSVDVTTPDIAASNGTVHLVDGVLLPTITDTAKGYEDGTTKFATLVAALGAADLAATLGGPGPFTVFAPTDAAFAKLPAGTVENLVKPENKATLQTILKYHVLSGAPVYAKDIKSGTVTSLSGNVTVTVTGTTVELNTGSNPKSKVILADLPTSNGVVHAIDTVILPPS